MSKNILMISSSPRKGGNSDALAVEFARGAREAGNRVEKIKLYNKTIGFCKGCLACQKALRCVIRDDADTMKKRGWPEPSLAAVQMRPEPFRAIPH